MPPGLNVNTSRARTMPNQPYMLEAVVPGLHVATRKAIEERKHYGGFHHVFRPDAANGQALGVVHTVLLSLIHDENGSAMVKVGVFLQSFNYDSREIVNLTGSSTGVRRRLYVVTPSVHLSTFCN
ncbi:hypothetical protein AYL99_11644 [Fonsecaea erecta]|uniref:Uncharacterized protein n=1 Tax=Fonsecaea erecta TaxID=1367422 RepID=A0A178Z2S8_9EURO|nr:hypothetical protein AYL99_11644 [Fonsecaea erecta]OAP54109.1 hypothetical protein AYL99_11644 [Fonsecaea erecta]